MEHNPETSDDTLKRLVQAAQQGDSVSTRALYDELVGHIYAYVRGRTYTTEQAVDTTQDVFVDFFAGLHRFHYRSAGQLHAYVYRIAKRKLAAYYKAHAAQAPVESFDETTMVSSADQAAAAARRDVEGVLGQLDAVAREIVELHHYAGYSFAEIGDLLEMSESAARVRHHRALKVLRASINT